MLDITPHDDKLQTALDRYNRIEFQMRKHHNDKSLADDNMIMNAEKHRIERMKMNREKREAEERKREHVNTTIEEAILAERNMAIQKKTWKTLDMCFKWELVKDYIETLTFKLTDQDIEKIRNSISDRTLLATYDVKSKKITKLNFNTEEHGEI